MAGRGRPKAELVLSDEESGTLVRWSRRATSAQALRCRIVLACADGLTNGQVAEKLSVSRPTVGKWRSRFATRRLEGLVDEPRPGAPRKITDEQVEQVVVALEDKPKDATHWSRDSMAKRSGMSRSTVGRIWKAFRLKPHLSETFKLSTDAQFVEKVRDVVGLYWAAPRFPDSRLTGFYVAVSAPYQADAVPPVRPRAIPPGSALLWTVGSTMMIPLRPRTSPNGWWRPHSGSLQSLAFSVHTGNRSPQRLHTETACRRGGALGLRVIDLDVDRGLIRLTEKGGTLRWQPITLDTRLAEHAQARGAHLPTDGLLRFRHGARLTYRRYDHLWHRLGEHLPWVATQGISTHWLRHTTLTWVERHFGYGIARAYSGHTDSTGATTTYIKADLQAVATALAAMTSQPHPLATTIAPPTSTAAS